MLWGRIYDWRTMKIGLCDVDGHHFPNLPLMKLSAWHKQRGDFVEWAAPLSRYDVVYQAKVFDFTPDCMTLWQADNIVKGGTGYGLDNNLPDEIEHMYPDYELYGIHDVAYGFLSRGCPRGCTFCIVGKKEGRKSVKVADLNEFWKGQREIKLLDPNLTACNQFDDLMRQLTDSRAYVDFTQGLDIRLMTPEKAKLLQQVKFKRIHFAWDNYPDMCTYEQLKKYRPYFGKDRRKLGVYVLTNYNTTLEQDLDRVYRLRELDYDPYIMIYDKQHAPKIIRQLQRWVNNKIIFRSTKRFEEFNPSYKVHVDNQCASLF